MCSPFSEMIIFHVGITPYFPRVEKNISIMKDIDRWIGLFNNISVL